MNLNLVLVRDFRLGKVGFAVGLNLDLLELEEFRPCLCYPILALDRVHRLVLEVIVVAVILDLSMFRCRQIENLVLVLDHRLVVGVTKAVSALKSDLGFDLDLAAEETKVVSVRKNDLACDLDPVVVGRKAVLALMNDLWFDLDLAVVETKVVSARKSDLWFDLDLGEGHFA
jgi:hypothetical protein